jgi:DNA end-binding protein Ku
MKSIWTGSIGFGLVNIPVKMYSAVQGSDLDLDMLDKADHANIHFKRVNADTGKEVPWRNIVRGYKLNDHYVVLTDQDFEKANPEKTKIIEIEEFVNEGEIDSLYYENAYYLEPEKSGVKPYNLLRESLIKTQKAAFGTYVLRNKQSLCLIKPHGQTLVLNKIRFPEEIKTPKDIRIPVSKPKPAELKMAIELINQLSGKFDFANYKDNYTDDLMKLIRSKAKGKVTKSKHLRVVHSPSTDLMNQLKASLNKKKRNAS